MKHLKQNHMFAKRKIADLSILVIKRNKMTESIVRALPWESLPVESKPLYMPPLEEIVGGAVTRAIVMVTVLFICDSDQHRFQL